MITPLITTDDYRLMYWTANKHMPANFVTQLLQHSHSYLQNQAERDICYSE